MIGLPNIGSSGLGSKSVNGRSLVPNPAPSTNAVRMRGAMNGLQPREGVQRVQASAQGGARSQNPGSLLELVELLYFLPDLTCSPITLKGSGTPSHHEIARLLFPPRPLDCLGARPELEFAGYHDP